MKAHAVIALSALLLVFGCTSLQQQKDAVRDNSADRVNVGTVQREIHKGMSGAEVIAVLGTPNMVTSDGNQRETWVYDKVATETVSSGSSGGLFLIFGSAQSGSGVTSTSQRTLTIILKFDEKHLLRDFSYRQSSF